MTERTFARRPSFTQLGVAKHACCFFDFSPAWGLSEIKATLCAAKAERIMVTAMLRRTIIKVLDLFRRSAKRTVLLKAELERLMLLAIVKGGTYITIIMDDYSRSQGAYVPETHWRHDGCAGEPYCQQRYLRWVLDLSHPYGQQRSCREYILLDAPCTRNSSPLIPPVLQQ